MAFKNERTFDRAVQEGRIEEVHSKYERAVESVLSEAGRSYPNVIGGVERKSGAEFEDRSPIDTSILVGRFQKGTKEEAFRAVEAASAAFEEWSRTDWSERVSIFKKVAAQMRKEKYILAAAVTLDNGKNRSEALADVDEAIDFIEYYSEEMRRNKGYETETQAAYREERVRSVLRPYGTWAVICPFNFPAGITTGMATGAMITGNTVVLKPPTPAPLPVYMVFDIFRRTGLPDGVLNFFAGPGGEVGDSLVNHPKVKAVVFTGSREVGYGIIRNPGRPHPIPVIAEMGGKNAIIVTSKAIIDDAVAGVASSAFGYGGQKCSACSRAYVSAEIFDTFVEKLVERTRALRVGDPRGREVDMGPVINEKAVNDFLRYAMMARRDGILLAGGSRLTGGGLDRGYYVEPTIASKLPEDHYLIRNELFLPFLCVQKVKSLEEAVRKANNVEYGLTGGIFSEDEKEIDYYFGNIEAGVVYANRKRGGSTGAMVGAQPFGGWKASGSTGKGAGGRYYLLQFMREQSRTVVGR